jgi:outer membrane receptor protein involved in Fe transport
MADIVRFDPFRLILGERYEVSDLEVSHPNTLNLPGEGIPATQRTEPSLLPSVNAVYSVSKESNIRVGYSRTVARPHFRELSPALYYDYVRRRTIGGNPSLVETSIQNVDLRWESFIGATEVVAASAFYKHFKQPIERFLDGDNVTFNNVAGAKAYGLELEGRMSLKRFAEALASTSVGANFSWIHSRIDIPGVDRPLQGQSPYVANFSIGQHESTARRSMRLMFSAGASRKSERQATKTSTKSRSPDRRDREPEAPRVV